MNIFLFSCLQDSYIIDATEISFTHLKLVPHHCSREMRANGAAKLKGTEKEDRPGSAMPRLPSGIYDETPAVTRGVC